MARFKIQSKGGKAERYEGKPRYIGSYLKPSYLEFSEIASPTPIAWEVGDYVDYPRTGMRYYLYSIPQPSKNARKGSHGRAFTYSNVQFHAATKELEIAPFRDLVSNDNNIHFSTSPDVATFEDVYGIARRIQACMDDMYPERWVIRVADFDSTEDADILESITTAKDFALSGGTCLDALSKIYELWQDIGWIHSYEEGKEVVTIGYANKRIEQNTSDPYLYGKGNGLTAIKKTQINRDEFATRLYVYGSNRNIPSRYYNGLDILNAESVDIRNLMLPLDKWGKTDGLPDARKAYLENAEAVAKYGVIPRVHYFDSEDAGADIYPSIERMTIGKVREALDAIGQTQYYPSEEIYPDTSERVDEVLSADNPTDDGMLKVNGKQYAATEDVNISGDYNILISSGSTSVASLERTLVDTSIGRGGRGEVVVKGGMNIVLVGEGIGSVRAVFELSNAYHPALRITTSVSEVAGVSVDSTTWHIGIPRMTMKFTQSRDEAFPVCVIVKIYVTPTSGAERNIKVVYPSNPLEVGLIRTLPTTFSIGLKQMGFDIDKQATLGEGKVISMKTGACAGRNFVISDCSYNSGTDSWVLTCARQQDDTLGMLFPYKDYPIQSGDRFVLLDIAMPDSYISANTYRLLDEGEKLLARASKVMTHYEPSIDAKVMLESGRSLREGMYMSVSDEDIIEGYTEYILIDTLSIYEDEGPIPTYKVTLRERRKVTYKGTPSATATTSTKSASTTEEDSGYATIGYVDNKTSEVSDDVKTLKDVLEDMFYFKDDNTIGTKYNIFSQREISAGGIGSESEEEGGEGGTLDSLLDVEIGDVVIDNTLEADEQLAVKESQVIGYDNTKGLWVNKKTMYIHNQSTATTVWKITHNLGKMPNVKVIDSTGALVYGTVVYDRDDEFNKVTISFGGAFSGRAYLD